MNLFGRLWSGCSGAKHQTIIISFCNLPKHSDSGLLLFDLCCSKTRWLELGLSTKVTSCTGISQADGYILSLAEFGEEVYVVVTNSEDFQPLYYQRLFEIRNAHSICVDGDIVLIVSTGTDEVVAYQWGPHGFTFQGTVWTPSQAKKDTHHINSITCVDRENILVTAFGPKKADLWQSASNGYVCNIKSGNFIKTGINQPHSLRASSQTLYYCESANQGLVALDGGNLYNADGYTRGLCFRDQNRVIFGTSVGRRKSKSTGIMRNPADPGDPFGVCGITALDLQTRCAFTTDMSKYGREIYDIHYVQQ